MLLKISIFILASIVLEREAVSAFDYTRGIRGDTCSEKMSSPVIEMANVISKVEEAPFIVACKKPPGLLKDRPETGIFVRTLPETDRNGRSTREFLLKVVKKARDRVSNTQNQILNIKKCMSDNSPKCMELEHWVKVDLPNYVKAARFHLSLGQGPGEIKTWASTASKKINTNLDTLGSYKLKDWSPLTNEETVRAKNDLSEYISEIDKEARSALPNYSTCGKCVAKFKEESLIAVRYQHYMTYYQMIAEVPLLQYLTEPEVSDATLSTAFGQMSQNLEKENDTLDEYEKALATTGNLSPDALKILNYSSLVEETLLEDNRDCGLATSLVYTMSNRQIGNTIAIGLPIMAVSIFAPPLIGVTAGIGAGSGFAYHSYSEFNHTQQRTLGFIYGDKLNQDQKNLDATAKQKNYDIVTLPIGFGLGNIAVKTLTASGKALISSIKIFKNFD